MTSDSGGSDSDQGEQPGSQELVEATRNGEVFNPDQVDWVQQALEVERQRIQSNDKRTEMLNAAISATDASDERQFEYFSKKLDLEDTRDNRVLTITSRLLWAALGVSVVFAGVVLWTALFGPEVQAARAEKLLDVLLHIIAGAGGLAMLRMLWTGLRSMGSGR